ncbi:unnamed protein product [Brachionus calyciflorus]|uniref:SMB domain-containing protein n=1 Tax=Brachionus calyciflorus TaxID=104777 RepID=A0A813N9H8_9BILA|nr:unnamed protein product [Brachionus calyciflorus]
MMKLFIILFLIQIVFCYDSRYFSHGGKQNEEKGGTCTEFLEINGLESCCSQRDDDCYMIHYDTRCYCDVFCDRSSFTDSSDCCPDAKSTCSLKTEQLVFTTKTSTRNPNCYKNGKWYQNGQTFIDNCNECRCQDGLVKCSLEKCLINTELLDKINSDPYSTWRAENYSNYWSKNQDYGYRHKLGTKIPNKIQRALRIDPVPIEESYDFREESFMINNVRPIRDQGECGASWAFAALDTATDRVAKVYEGKRGNESMSIQMIISCVILPGNANGCSPATMDLGWKFIESSSKENDGKIVGGIVNEKCYPLESDKTGIADACKVNSNLNRVICPSDDRLYNKPLMNSGPGYPIRPASTNDLMEEIKENGPVQMAFKVYEDFFMYKSGIYSKHPDAKLLDVEEPYHSVKVLGWGSENGVDYWIAANSWGPEWGENGYFRIKRQDDETEFGRYGYAAWGSKPINTNKKNSLGKSKYRNYNIQRRE